MTTRKLTAKTAYGKCGFLILIFKKENSKNEKQSRNKVQGVKPSIGFQFPERNRPQRDGP